MKRAVVILACVLMALEASAQSDGTIKDGMRAISDKYGVHFVYDSSLPVNQPFSGQAFRKKRLQDALNTLFYGSGIEWQKKGRYITLKTAKQPPTQELICLSQMDTITAASITGIIDRDINYTQTGLTKIDGDAFNRAFACLSSPDVLKTLQALPGVASGTEMLSNLYVHGGDGSDNLFLLDGVPLYQICHLGGIFSSFNTDIIENIEFYKSGFPARYGGRTSSVVDVTTKDGDYSHYKGQASIGLLEGRIQAEGPLVKDRTSFNIAVRRSWADAIMYPVCLIQNRQRAASTNDGKNYMLGYSFTDFNAKISHLFSTGNKLAASIYWGNDYLTRCKKTSLALGSANVKDENKLAMSWGNILASVRWQKEWSEKTTSDFIGFWSACHSAIGYHYYENGDSKHIGTYNNHQGVTNNNILDDIGATVNIGWEKAPNHQVRVGGSLIYHSYRPDYYYYETYRQEIGPNYNLAQRDSVRSFGLEGSVYAEDEVGITSYCKVNVGFRNTIYSAPGKTWIFFEPRLALKIQCTYYINAKVSYARMSQYSHKMASTYLDLPTDCWLPSSNKLAPMCSHQFAGGIYSRPAKNIHFNVEGWFKKMDHLVEYFGDNTFFPRLNNWESIILIGNGRSYGLELDFGYETPELTLNAFYTLSWNERFFEQIYQEWYRDRNDNRNKLTLQANWRINKKWELYGAWCYHNGNRMTLPTQYLQGVYVDGDGRNSSFYHQWIYEVPNNAKLPDYHRLDLGTNIHGITKRGNKYVWNISIYNVYCKFNPVFAIVGRQGINHNHPDYDPGYVAFKGIGTSIVPILPSFSYRIYLGR